eukprot:CAMPEP_0114576998 /NCGR_PEP_ID=MMETSP0125-20121206/1712_1 /TAXON_ID=485358 ORGANISM="Aristerostoma sp., Strain ATCC 50986" /NCGR_SAMPLE_ID=MMETSP0125 /ASSEMBLY_ACC=CAM_ASM_000245 /LENGTH=397 /DNA_ID=CAMNT_0001765977 /DNA_START=1972 /DNA_END=3165 /DNA_ORIENTATION=-
MDIRVYEIKVTVQPKPVKAQIEIHCPARSKLEQPIPVYNNSEKDTSIRPVLNAYEYSHYFEKSNRELFVKRRSQGNYILKFAPDNVCKAEAKLTLVNPVTNDIFEYEITAHGEEPLAEDHIVLNCKARKPLVAEIPVRNFYNDRPVNFRIETDLINTRGASNLVVQPGDAQKYKLEVTPLLGGVYTGSITFIDPETEAYLWYTVEIRTESPKAEKSIDLITKIRKAVAFDINLRNPLDEVVEFEVIMNGEGIIGEDRFVLLPGQTGVYELVFSPLKPLKEIGSVAFIHEKLGEIWYELHLEAEDPGVVKLDTLQAELGKTAIHKIELENPSANDVAVRYMVSNPYNFDIQPENLMIPRYSSIVVDCRYSPSDLNTIESTEITFETDEIGIWRFYAYG